MPSLSKEEVPNNVINVTYWRVNNGMLFRETIGEIISAIRSDEGEPRGYWYSANGGDLQAPHYFVVDPYENFAGMDVSRDNVMTVVENELGSSERDRLMKDYMDSVDEVWSFMYRKVDELSHSSN